MLLKCWTARHVGVREREEGHWWGLVNRDTGRVDGAAAKQPSWASELREEGFFPSLGSGVFYSKMSDVK